MRFATALVGASFVHFVGFLNQYFPLSVTKGKTKKIQALQGENMIAHLKVGSSKIEI